MKSNSELRIIISVGKPERNSQYDRPFLYNSEFYFIKTRAKLNSTVMQGSLQLTDDLPCYPLSHVPYKEKTLIDQKRKIKFPAKRHVEKWY